MYSGSEPLFSEPFKTARRAKRELALAMNERRKTGYGTLTVRQFCRGRSEARIVVRCKQAGDLVTCQVRPHLKQGQSFATGTRQLVERWKG